MSRPSSPRPPATPDSKTAADLMSVLPMTAEVRDGHLWIGGLDTVELAAQTRQFHGILHLHRGTAGHLAQMLIAMLDRHHHR